MSRDEFNLRSDATEIDPLMSALDPGRTAKQRAKQRAAEGAIRISAAHAATAAIRERHERLALRRAEIEARRQLAAEIARHHDRLRLGLIPPPYKPGPLEW
jgi:hypothetical protein